MKRNCIIAGALLVALLAAPHAEAQAPLKMDIPFQSVGVGVLPFWVAIDGGHFKKYGIDATTQFVSQSPTVIASMLSGETPFAISGQDAVVSADLNGGDIVILASGPEKLFFSIYGAPSLHTIADLKGKKIGISQFGATTDFVLRYIMAQANMSPSDSSILPVGTTANNLSAMQAGVIDATVLAPPTTLKLKQLGFNQVADMADYGLIFYTSCLDAKKSWVDDHHDATMNIVRGYLSGIAATFNDKQGTLATLAKYSQTTDQDVLEGSYDTLIKALPKVPTPKIEAVQTALSQSKQPAAKSANPASFIDTSFVDALERDGFIASLYKARE